MTASSDPFLPRAVANSARRTSRLVLARVSSRRLRFDQAAKLADFFGDSGDALGHGFEFEGELAALSAEGFDLEIGVGDFGFQAAGFAVGAGEALFGLRELVAQPRGGRHRVENGDARFFLLTFEFCQRGGGSGGFLLGQREFVLRRGQIGGGGFQHLPVGIALGFKRGQAMTSLRQFGFRRGRANQQFGAAFFVVAAAGVGAIDFQAIWLIRSRFSRSSVSMA